MFLHRPRLIVGQKHFCDGNWKQAGHTHTSRQLKMNKRCKKIDPCAINPVPDQKPLAERRKSRAVGKGTKIFHELLAAAKNKAENFTNSTKVIACRGKASAERSGKTRPSEVYPTHLLHTLHWVARLQKSPTVQQQKKIASLLLPQHACVFCWVFFYFCVVCLLGGFWKEMREEKNTKIYFRKI